MKFHAIIWYVFTAKNENKNQQVYGSLKGNYFTNTFFVRTNSTVERHNKNHILIKNVLYLQFFPLVSAGV